MINVSLRVRTYFIVDTVSINLTPLIRELSRNHRLPSDSMILASFSFILIFSVETELMTVRTYISLLAERCVHAVSSHFRGLLIIHVRLRMASKIHSGTGSLQIDRIFAKGCNIYTLV